MHRMNPLRFEKLGLDLVVKRRGALVPSRLLVLKLDLLHVFASASDITAKAYKEDSAKGNGAKFDYAFR